MVYIIFTKILLIQNLNFMFNNYRKQLAFLVLFLSTSLFMSAQTDTSMNRTNSMMSSSDMIYSSKPFTGTKGFRKFSIGLNVGALTPNLVIGGQNDYTKPKVGFGYGANLKYQFTHLFALELNGLRGTVQGDNSKKVSNGAGGEVLPNFPETSFKTDLDYALTINSVFTFGNINWLRPITKVVPYVSVGGGLAHYKPTVTYKNGLSGSYTSTELVVPVAAGLKFNLSPGMNLDLGYRMNFIDGDNFDGARRVDAHKDRFAYTFVGLEFSLGGKAKPQLMFDNPAYRSQAGLQYQIDSLKNSLRIVDTDGDGVIDQLDQCPNTPAGVAVNTHGCPLDTDGDGVPDYKDKELITPTYCQPVDADGVGKCPPPACCSDMVAKSAENANACNLGDLPSISFKGNSSLSADAKAMLATVASKLKSSATCSITISGYPSASKASQAVCNRRTAVIKNYLIEKEGISADRISVTCEIGGGDANTVDIKTNK